MNSTASNDARPLISPGRRRKLQSSLLDWFAVAQRPLPWRVEYDPYAVWISEIMLQQTQVESVLPYYARWMSRFPDVAAVAKAPEQVLLKFWEGLGYYARARNLQNAARKIVEFHGGVLPQSAAQLLALPGIGPYSAGAIASIAYNQDAAAVDGNIARVLSRLFALEDPVDSPPGKARLWALARALLPHGRARDFNQGLMELGALICRSKSPGCAVCPLLKCCDAGRRGAAGAYPRRSPPVKRRQVAGVMLLPMQGGRQFMRRRPSAGLWGGLWEFPWVERAPGESAASTAELLLEGLCLPRHAPLIPLGRISHGLTHLQLKLDCFLAALPETRSGQSPAAEFQSAQSLSPMQAVSAAGQAQRWVKPAARKRLALARLSHKAVGLWENHSASPSPKPSRGDMGN